MRDDVTHHTVEVPTGETIGCRHRPGDAPVVLLHGNMTSSKHWDLVLESMDDDFDLYAVDLRGFGESSYREPIDGIDDFAADVAGFVDAVGLDRFHLVGWSGAVDRIEAPTLVLRGEDDLVVSRAMVEQTVADLGDCAELRHLPGCGHSPLVDDLDRFLEHVEGFLRGPGDGEGEGEGEGEGT
jgi:pimeloyl-ACP methyl ester carboxylesterase